MCKGWVVAPRSPSDQEVCKGARCGEAGARVQREISRVPPVNDWLRDEQSAALVRPAHKSFNNTTDISLFKLTRANGRKRI